MEGSIRLTASQRKTALQVYRGGGDARVARRAHVLLLLDQGRSYREIMKLLFCSSDLIAGVKRRFLSGGLPECLAEPEGDPSVPIWHGVVVDWVKSHNPGEFGYFRSRWSCEVLRDLLREERLIEVSGETVRRVLHRNRLAWRRPRPFVGPEDPDYARKLGRVRRLLNSLPDNEAAVFQDEVDVHLNPKIGCCWMPIGEQARVETPGNNVKRHVAGSLVWRTGTLLISPPCNARNADLFVAHLDDLRRRLRSSRKIHVICDNAPFHDCRKVREYLESWGHRIQLHFLPKYAPETNPIERVWWHLHETITRCHKCRSMDELLELAYDWFQTNNNHFDDMRNSFAAAA